MVSIMCARSALPSLGGSASFRRKYRFADRQRELLQRSAIGAFFTFAILLLTSSVSCAAGPEIFARFDLSGWRDGIATPQDFDRASRGQILVFAQALANGSALEDGALAKALKVVAVNRDSIIRVRNRLAAELVKNYALARESCAGRGDYFCEPATSEAELIEAGRRLVTAPPARYAVWIESLESSNRHYAAELLRLAALFPGITSEIDRFSDIEHAGDELPDRHFLLTFDDGPTPKGGSTDTLLRELSARGVHALFFVLGEALAVRSKEQEATDLRAAYSGQCIGLHGWSHRSHQVWPEWMGSILRTRDLALAIFPEQYRPYFRPPFGQRSSESGRFFRTSQLTVALWNIDTQDWSSALTASDVAQRTLALMLLWRHGVILFHDTVPIAQSVVPWLLDQTGSAGVIWEDCRSLDPRTNY